MKPDIKTIVITSNEPWGNVWVSKHHYAHELSQMGYLVYFINSPRHWSPFNLFSLAISVKNINDKLVVIDYKNNFPLRIFPKLFLRFNDYLNSWKLSTVINKKEPLLWWQFDPFRFIDVHFLNVHKRIYHVVDPYEQIWSDREIAKRSHLLVSVSKYYESHYKKHNKTFLYIPHGIGSSEQKVDQTLLEEIKNKYGEGFIVFVGIINEDVDLKLLSGLAEEIHDKKILIIGPMMIDEKGKAEFQRICDRPNVQYIGAVASDKLKNYVALSSVGIVPYKEIKTVVHRTPLKIISYLAQNKPIVTIINYELSELNDKIIFITRTREEFIGKIKHILDGKVVADTTGAKNYIQKVSYPKLIQTILKEL